MQGLRETSLSAPKSWPGALLPQSVRQRKRRRSPALSLSDFLRAPPAFTPAGARAAAAALPLWAMFRARTQ